MAARPDLAARNRERALHGKTGTRAFAVWQSMRQRCTDTKHKAYPDYGGRGIGVCARWGEFSEFYSDMGDPPPGQQLDRIDNNGDYCPANCRWASPQENSNNRRSNVYLEYRGERRSIADWARVTGIERKTLQYRVKAGWPIERALTTPSITNRKRTNGDLT